MHDRELVQQMKNWEVVQRGDFTLASGKKSKILFDVKRALVHPYVLRATAAALEPHVRIYDKLAGVELGGLMLAEAIGLYSNADVIAVRHPNIRWDLGGPRHAWMSIEDREKAMAMRTTRIPKLVGNWMSGHTAVIVDDVLTTGGSAIHAADALREERLIVDLMVCVVDRGEGGRANLAKIGVKVKSLFTPKDFGVKLGRH